MKILRMPAVSPLRSVPTARSERSLRPVIKSISYGVASVLALILGLIAAIVIAALLALALAAILGLVLASAAALVFMVINPEGNLLLLLVLSQVWLLFAPRERTHNDRPDGGLTIGSGSHAAAQPQRSLAA